MISPLLYQLAGWVIRAIAFVTRPSSAACLPGWSVEGVRPSGHTDCVGPLPPDDGSCYGAARCDFADEPDPARIPIRIYCRPDQIAVVVDHQRIACRPRRARV